MPIVAEIRDECLALAGLQSVTDGPPGIIYRIISDINRGIDLIADRNPAVFFQVRPDQAEYVHAPATLTFSVTQGSKEVTISGGYDVDWMAGCAVLISGDSNLNRLANEETGDNPKLEKPYLGPTGSATGTVFHDWVRLPANVDMLMEPVVMLGRKLFRSMSIEQLAWRYMPPGVVRDYDTFPVYPFLWEKQRDEPWQYYEVARVVQDELLQGVMLDALPPSATNLSYTAKIGIGRVTSLNDTRNFITPRGKDQEILLPIVRWFFSSYVGVSTASKQDLVDEYETALRSAAELSLAGNPRKRYVYTSQR